MDLFALTKPVQIPSLGTLAFGFSALVGLLAYVIVRGKWRLLPVIGMSAFGLSLPMVVIASDEKSKPAAWFVICSVGGLTLLLFVAAAKVALHQREAAVAATDARRRYPSPMPWVFTIMVAQLALWSFVSGILYQLHIGGMFCFVVLVTIELSPIVTLCIGAGLAARIGVRRYRASRDLRAQLDTT